MADDIAKSTGWSLYQGEAVGAVGPWYCQFCILGREERGERSEKDRKGKERNERAEGKRFLAGQWPMILQAAQAGSFTKVNLLVWLDLGPWYCIFGKERKESGERIENDRKGRQERKARAKDF